MSVFYDYLESYARSDTAEDRAEIEASLWDEFGVEQAIFILDMAGFSMSVEERGIVHYLSMMQRMRMTVEPLIRQNGGTVIKFEADNCFARFPDTLQAVQTAIIYNHTLSAMNLTTPDDLDIHAAIGIDFGKFLLVKSSDAYGMPVNVASKLGEDVASSEQILVSKQAMDRIDEHAGINSSPLDIKVSGLQLEAVEIIY
jgi:adenylate cyclase